MSKEAAPAPADGAAPPKKKGKLKSLLMFVVGAGVLVGGGVGAGLYAARGSGGGAHEEVAKKDLPKLVPKGEGKHEEASGEGGGHGGGEAKEGGESGGGHGAPVDGPKPDPSKFDATYYALEQPFTANLRDSDGLVQVSLGVATYYDSRVIDNLKRHEMPVRSAILMTLADQDPNALATPAGKTALQAALTASINTVLRQKEGFGGIDDVYFSSFIVQ